MMKNQKRVSRNRFFLVAIVTVMMLLGLSVVFDFYYDLNDDTVIKDIISGTYTGKPSGYSVQMLYPLSWLLALCYRAISGIAWYGLFLCLCQFGAFALIAWRVTELVEKKGWQICALVVTGILYVGLLARELVMIQYSVTSGICMATAIFLYLTAKPCETIKQALKINSVAICLVVLSFMMRTEMCLMLFPFLALAGLSKWSEEKPFFAPKTIGKYLSVLSVALLSMGIVMGMDALAYRQEGWSEYRAFFDARTKLYDFYGIPAYEGNEAFYESIGLSKESYDLLQNYNFALDEEIDVELLEKIVTYQEKMAKTETNHLHVTGGMLITKNTLKEGIWLYKQHLLQMADGLWGYLIVVGYLLCAFYSMRKSKSGLLWKLFLLLVIRSGLWIYLFMVDRMVNRLIIPLLFSEVCVLFGLLVTTYQKTTVSHAVVESDCVDKRFVNKALVLGVWGLIGVCGIAACATNLPEAYEEYVARENVNTRWETLLSYAKENSDSFYVVDVYSSTSYQGVPYAEKVFENVDYTCRNWDLCGGWLVKSPLTIEKYTESGFTQLEEALCENKQVYFVAGIDKDVNWLSNYYESKGKVVKPVCIDYVLDAEENIFTVYTLQKQ